MLLPGDVACWDGRFCGSHTQAVSSMILPNVERKIAVSDGMQCNLPSPDTPSWHVH